MQKKNLIVLGAALLVGLLFIVGQKMFSSGSGTSTGSTGSTETIDSTAAGVDSLQNTVAIIDAPRALQSNPTAKEILESIEKMKGKPWDRLAFLDIESKISSAYTNALLKKDEEAYLSQYLNLSYMAVLKKAVKSFFRNSSRASDLAPIYREVRRYARGGYRAEVNDVYTASLNFYALRDKTRAIESYVSGTTCDESEIGTFFSDLGTLKSKDYLRKSSLVGTMVREAKGSLQSFLGDTRVADLRTKVDNYTYKERHNEGISNSFKAELKGLKENEYLRTYQPIQSYCNRAEDALEQQFVHHQLFFNNVSADPNTCAAIFGDYSFYVDSCITWRADNGVSNGN